jgi:hypothetical protein
MINGIRNELLTILCLLNKTTEEDKKRVIEELLDRFEYDIRNQLEDTKRKEKELEDNLETLEYVRNEILK